MPSFALQFVLLLQDDYNGADLRGEEFRFHVNGMPARPIRKPEGFCVFTGLEGESWDVTIEAARYQTRKIHLEKAKIPPANPVEVVRLFRSEKMRSADCEVIDGKGEKNALVYALCEDVPPLRLSEIKDGRLYIQGFPTRPLVRQRFCVGKGKAREMFVIQSRDPDGGYQVDRHFQKRHQKDEPILRAYGAVCDPAGRFVIPVGFGMKDTLKSIEIYDEEVGQWGGLCQTAPTS